MKNSVPVFIKIEEYEEIINILDTMKAKLTEASDLLAKVEDLKRKEDDQVKAWKQELDDVEQRIVQVDAKLSHPQ